MKIHYSRLFNDFHMKKAISLKSKASTEKKSLGGFISAPSSNTLSFGTPEG
jgi:hypothetical protein